MDERYLRQGMLRWTSGLYIGQTAYGWRSYCPNASQWWCDSMIWIHGTGVETKGNGDWWWERLIFFFSEPFWEQDPSSSEVGEGGGGGGAEHGPLVRQRQNRSPQLFIIIVDKLVYHWTDWHPPCITLDLQKKSPFRSCPWNSFCSTSFEAINCN